MKGQLTDQLSDQKIVSVTYRDGLEQSPLNVSEQFWPISAKFETLDQLTDNASLRMHGRTDLPHEFVLGGPTSYALVNGTRLFSVYTTALVQCSWAGAVIWLRFFWHKFQLCDVLTNRQCDRLACD